MVDGWLVWGCTNKHWPGYTLGLVASGQREICREFRELQAQCRALHRDPTRCRVLFGHWPRKPESVLESIKVPVPRKFQPHSLSLNLQL